MTNRAAFIADCRSLYRRTLLEDVAPFWMRHGIDRKHGGISNVIDDRGAPINFDKYLWSQGRALWTFSALYNRVEKRPEWLAFADHLYRYLSTHGRDEQGRWMYRLDERGNVLDRDISISVDGFVMAGLSEYAAATGSDAALNLALATCDSIRSRLEIPGSYGVAPYEIPAGLKTHGIAMLFSFFFFNLGEIAKRPDIAEAGQALAREILADFYDPKRNAILEFAPLTGSRPDTPPARTCVMGHAIEALWFMITMFERTGRSDLIPSCADLIRRHIELAWDDTYGGLMLARDMDGKEPCYWKRADCKAWWVHCEALVATAYAHLHTGQDWCLEWHSRIREYAFARYPVPTGEWTQWLDRQGNTMPSAALPVKDPFHLPRALIYLIGLFEKPGMTA